MKILKLYTFLMFTGILVQAAGIIQVPRTEAPADVLKKSNLTAWSRAVALHSFVLINTPDGEPSAYPTQVRLFHDGTRLYIIAFCPAEGDITAIAAEHDQDAWDDDNLAFMLVPNPDKPNTYYHIAINSKGTVYDEAYTVPRQGKSSWNAEGLEVNTEKRTDAYLIYASVPLKSLGIINPKQQFAMNFARTYKAGGKTEYSSWARTPRPSFHETASYPLFALDTQAPLPAKDYSFSTLPELCVDGEFELGTNERMIQRNGGWTCNYYSKSGKNSFSIEGSANAHRSASTRLPLKGGERYIASWAVRYNPLESANHKPLEFQFFDAADKLLSSVESPGLGNLGGGVGNNTFSSYSMDFEAPEGTDYAMLRIKLYDSGIFFIDSLRVSKFYERHMIPEPVFPEPDSVQHSTELTFTWNLFAAIINATPGGCTLQLSRDPDFPEAQTISYAGTGYKEWKVSLPEQGKWFWRVRFDGKFGGTWSETSSFTLDCSPAKEKIPPQIGAMSPRGRIPTRPKSITWNFSDGQFSSGINSVELKINGAVVTPVSVTDSAVVFELPGDGKDFYHLILTVSDNNKNTSWDADFIYISSAPGIMAVDKQGFITRDGQRIFPISRYAQQYTDTFPVMQEKGYNSNLSPWKHIADPLLMNNINLAYMNGIGTFTYVFPGVELERGLASQDSAYAADKEAQNLKGLAKIKGHPGIIGFYIGDESLDAGGIMGVYESFCGFLKQQMPEQIITWLPSWSHSNPSLWHQADQFNDLLLYDDYVINRKMHLRLFNTIDMLNRETKVPAMNILGAHSLTSEWRTSKRTLPQMEDLRFCMYAAIIGGSRGMIFYTDPDFDDFANKNPYGHTNRPEFLEILFTLANELRELTPYLIQDDGDPAGFVKTVSGQARTMLKELDGKLLLMAVNAGSDPCTLRLTLPEGTSAAERISGKLYKSGDLVELPFIGTGIFEIK